MPPGADLGVALYYLPPPGEPNNWLAQFVHEYTGTTNQYAAATYNAWLQSLATGPNLADLERQITDRMLAREQTFREAQRLAVQERLDAATTFRTLATTRTQMRIANQRSQTDLAVARTQQQTEFTKAGNLLDEPAAATLLNTTKAQISAFGQDLRAASAIPDPEQRAMALDRVARQLDQTMMNQFLAASRTLEPLQMDELNRELLEHAQLTMGDRGPEGLVPGDPDASAILLNGVNNTFRPTPEQPNQQFGAGQIDPQRELNAALSQTRQALGLPPGAALPASTGRSVSVGGSGAVPGGGSPVSTIGPDELNLDALRDQIVADHAARRRTLEETLVRILAPGALGQRDRQIRRAIEQHATLDPAAGVGSGDGQFNAVSTGLDPNLGSLNQGTSTRELGGGPLPADTFDPRTGRRDPAAGGGRAAASPGPPEGASAPQQRAPARAPAGLRADSETGLAVTPEASFRMTLNDAQRLNGQVPQQGELDELLERALSNPGAISDEIWAQLVDWQTMRLAIDQALLDAERGDDFTAGFEAQQQRLQEQRQARPPRVEPNVPLPTAPAPATPRDAPATPMASPLTDFASPPRRPGVEGFDAGIVNDTEHGPGTQFLTISPEATDEQRELMLRNFERSRRLRERPAIDEQESLLRMIDEERRNRAAQ